MSYVIHYTGQKCGWTKDFSAKKSERILTDLEAIVKANEATKNFLPNRKQGGALTDHRLMGIYFNNEAGAVNGSARYLSPVVAHVNYPKLGERALIDFYLLLENATQQQFESLSMDTKTKLTEHGLKVIDDSGEKTQEEYEKISAMLRRIKI